MRKSIKKIAGYFVPIIHKKIPTDFNGIVELAFQDGKKVLDSTNANYSYGLLQKVLKVGLEKIKPSSDASILILGLGGGCVIETLQQDFNHNGNIVGVDIDPIIIEIAKQEFGWADNPKLSIVCMDASEFVTIANNRFDVIIVDIFIDQIVPAFLYQNEFWQHIQKLLSPKGKFLFNAGMKQQNISEIDSLIPFLEKNFKLEQLTKVKSVNHLLIGEE